MPGEPQFIMRFIEARGGGPKEYIILKLQSLTLLVFLLALMSLFSQDIWPRAIIAFIVVVELAIAAFQLRGFEDCVAIAAFFSGMSVFAFILSLASLLVPKFDTGMAVGLFALFIVIVLAYKFLFARGHTFGEVLTSGNGWAVVKVGYDVAAGVPNGYYAVRCTETVKTGSISKLSVRRSFGESARPWEIIH